MTDKTEQSEQFYRVVEPFSFDHEGVMYVMPRGRVVGSGNPALAGRENLFEEVTSDALRAQATEMRTFGARETADAVPGVPREAPHPTEESLAGPEQPDATPSDPDATPEPAEEPPAAEPESKPPQSGRRRAGSKAQG